MAERPDQFDEVSRDTAVSLQNEDPIVIPNAHSSNSSEFFDTATPHARRTGATATEALSLYDTGVNLVSAAKEPPRKHRASLG